MSEWTLLLDYGACASAAAIGTPGRVQPVEVSGSPTTPSGVFTDGNGKLTVGLTAQRQARLTPERYVRAPLLSSLSPSDRVAAVSEVFRVLGREAVQRQRSEPSEVRVTVRTSVTEGQIMRDAVSSAGFGALPMVLVDPLLATALGMGADSPVAVCDLGGSGFSCAVISGDTVLASGFVPGVGGEAFDALLFREVVAKAVARQLLAPPNATWRRAAEDLHRETRRAKEELSSASSATVDTTLVSGSVLEIRRPELEDLLRPSIRACVEKLVAVLARASVEPGEVYLTGGGARIPLLTRMIAEELELLPTLVPTPRETLLTGAARATVPTRSPAPPPVPTPPLTPAPAPPTPAPAPPAPEPSAPEPSAPEPEPSTPEPSAPEPEPSAPEPEPSAPGPSAPAPPAPEPSAPEPEPSTPEPSAPEPEPSTPEPEPSTAEASTSAPAPTAPEPSTSEPSTSEPSTSEPSTPEPSTPESPDPSATKPASPMPAVADPQRSGPATDPSSTQPLAIRAVPIPPKSSEPARPPLAAQPAATGAVVEPPQPEPAAQGSAAKPVAPVGVQPAAAAPVDGQPEVRSPAPVRPAAAESAAPVRPAAAEPVVPVRPAAAESAAPVRPAAAEPVVPVRPAAAEPVVPVRPAAAEPVVPVRPAAAAAPVRPPTRPGAPVRAAGAAGAGAEASLFVPTPPGGAAPVAHGAPAADAARGPDGAGGPGGGRGRRLWVPVLAGAAALVVVASTLTLNSVLNNRDEKPADTDAVAVSGLRADVSGISVNLSWTPFPGADSYRLYRDPRTAAQTARVVTGTTFTDRPGDAAQHTYSVIALDGAEVAGQPAPLVKAKAKAPYRGAQRIASTWTDLVPERQGKAGAQGQVCRTQGLVSQYSNGEIRCVFDNGVRLQILSYESPDDRDRRAQQLGAESGASEQAWSAAGADGRPYAGRMIKANSPRERTQWPWRFWTFEQEPGYAVYATWPHHTGRQLGAWWQAQKPFR